MNRGLPLRYWALSVAVPVGVIVGTWLVGPWLVLATLVLLLVRSVPPANWRTWRPWRPSRSWLAWRPWHEWRAWRARPGLLPDARRGGKVRRAWGKAVRECLGDSKVAIARKIRSVAAGDVVHVEMRPGHAVKELQDRREHLAGAMRLRDVRVVREPDDASRARVTLVRRDPFADLRVVRSPLLTAERTSLWDWAQLGADEDGQPVGAKLPERNLLVGGEVGSGKSVLLNSIVGLGALDPLCVLRLIDGKATEPVEFTAWDTVARESVGANHNQACRVLRELGEVMDERYATLKRMDPPRKKIRRDMDLPLHLLVIDELPFFYSNGEPKQRQEFAERLLGIVQRGRAAGIITVLAAQKPDADTIPSALRDIIGFRVAFRCLTPEASDTILGRGWASRGVSATDIPGDQRGVGWVLAEGAMPFKMRACFLSEDNGDEGRVASRALQARLAAEWQAQPEGAEA